MPTSRGIYCEDFALLECDRREVMNKRARDKVVRDSLFDPTAGGYRYRGQAE
jgi:hypothetical protein